MTHILCINPTQPHLTRRELIADLHIWAHLTVNNGGLDRWLYMIGGKQVHPWTDNEDEFVGSVYILSHAIAAKVPEQQWLNRHKADNGKLQYSPCDKPKLLTPEDFKESRVQFSCANFKGFNIELNHNMRYLKVSKSWRWGYQEDSINTQEACDIVNKELSK